MSNVAAAVAGMLTVLFINVLGGMIPGNMTGQIQLAFWLGSLLIGVLTYVAIASRV